MGGHQRSPLLVTSGSTPPIEAVGLVTRCGDLTVVTCTLSMSQEVGWSTLPADPAPFLLVHRGTGDAAKVVAIANTNRPK